jgi:hypothetical protein
MIDSYDALEKQSASPSDSRPVRVRRVNANFINLDDVLIYPLPALLAAGVDPVFEENTLLLVKGDKSFLLHGYTVTLIQLDLGPFKANSEDRINFSKITLGVDISFSRGYLLNPLAWERYGVPSILTQHTVPGRFGGVSGNALNRQIVFVIDGEGVFLTSDFLVTCIENVASVALLTDRRGVRSARSDSF